MPVRRLSPLGAALLLFFLSVSTSAQNEYASVGGRVVDPNQATIPGAQVTLQPKGNRISLTGVTDKWGGYHFDRVSPGEYHLVASARGFAPADQLVSLSSGQDQVLNVTLELASLAESVVVTASQLLPNAEVLERTPGSVDIIDAEMLENSRALHSSEALRKIAGVNARDEEGFGLRPNIGIRGLNPTRSTKVLLLEDGLPLTYAPYGDNASYYHPPIDRFQSVEIVKGSGQILYGPQTVGGVINYITPDPPLKPAGSILLTGGNRDYFNGHVNYGGTWKSTGLLFDYMRKQGEGSRDNLRFGINDLNFKSVSAIGSRHALTVKTNYYGERSNVTYSGLTEAEFQANPRGNIFRNDFFFGDRFGLSATHAFVVNSQTVLTTSFYNSIFKRHWWRQSSNSGERPNRLNTLPGGDPDCTSLADLSTTCGNQGRLRKYYTRGVQSTLRTSFSFLGLRNEADVGGRIHFETQDRVQQNGDTPRARVGVTVEDNERKNSAYSGFFQNRMTAGDWTITPGLRVEHIKYQRTNNLANAGNGITGRTRLTELVPGIGVAYHPSAKLNLFAGVHRGFAPPRTEDIINNNTGGTIDLDPEFSWNYEVGTRTRPVNGVQFDATFFRMDYENQIIPASLAGGVGATLTNGGETLHQGIEVTGRVDSGSLFRSPHNFYVRAAYTYLPIAKFTGMRFSSIGGFGNVSINGRRLPYAPENLLNLNVGYSRPSGFDSFIEGVYVGSQFGDDLNTVVPTPNGQRGLIPSYMIWNATFNYRVESWRSTFFVTVKNLFDRTYIVDRARGILPGSPRLMQAGLKFQF